ncbi:methyltransferase [Nocardia sp. NPDC046473]|uniref:methyltransferase n=1 Tax=Nocardia sp. NPDC046473 TaxID=3155733 RepID=UPI0033D3762C
MNRFLTGTEARLVADRYDFTRATTIVDVGGRDGRLLTALVQSYPLVEGILFDQPEVTREARNQFAANGLSERCRAIVGDIFAAVPQGADHYILNSVLRDCDTGCIDRLLSACRIAMGEDSTLLMVTYRARRSAEHPRSLRNHDRSALIELGGVEHSEQMIRAVLDQAGLRLDSIIDTRSSVHILVCHRADSRSHRDTPPDDRADRTDPVL